MASKFHRGAVAYAKDGRAYTVEEVEGGTVYCTAPGGAETEFPEAALMTAAEWEARSAGKRDLVYQRLRQARPFVVPDAKLDPAAAEQVLQRFERLSPSILDFTAFTAATRVLAEAGEGDLAAGLSIVKCRAVFDAASPEIRASLLARLLGAAPDALVGAAKLGDNLLRAMLDKGLEAQAQDYEDFQDRPRR